MPDLINLPLTPQEAHTLLRLIATANDTLERTATGLVERRQMKLDVATGTWVADRLLKLVDPGAGERAAKYLNQPSA